MTREGCNFRSGAKDLGSKEQLRVEIIAVPKPTLSLIEPNVRKRWQWLLHEKKKMEKKDMTVPRYDEEVYCRYKGDIDRSIWKGLDAMKERPGRVTEERGRDPEPRSQEIGIAKMVGLIWERQEGGGALGRETLWSGGERRTGVGWGRICLPGCLCNR